MRHRIGIILAALALLVSCAACKLIGGILIGAGGGSLLGPVGTVGGAIIGGTGGHVWDENDRLKLELKEERENGRLEITALRREMEVAKRELIDLRARADANKFLPRASAPLDFNVSPQPGYDDVAWYRREWGWFELRTWFFIALGSFAALVMRRWIKFLFGLIPWDAIWTLITNFGPKKRAPSQPRVIDEEEICP